MFSGATWLGFEEAAKSEKRRLWKLAEIEREARLEGLVHIAGVDEAGRGPLAGPVVAAACMIPEDHFIVGVNDCKKLTPKYREQLYEILLQQRCICIGVGIAQPEEIDRLNIFQATLQAMLRAIEGLTQVPELLLVDGLNLPHPTVPARRVIGGDGLCHSIAAASVVAKVMRDRMMADLHIQFPQYGFAQHKGYPTPQHRKALKQYGPCSAHRTSFAPVRQCARVSSLPSKY